MSLDQQLVKAVLFPDSSQHTGSVATAVDQVSPSQLLLNLCWGGRFSDQTQTIHLAAQRMVVLDIEAMTIVVIIAPTGGDVQCPDCVASNRRSPGPGALSPHR